MNHWWNSIVRHVMRMVLPYLLLDKSEGGVTHTQTRQDCVGVEIHVESIQGHEPRLCTIHTHRVDVLPAK